MITCEKRKSKDEEGTEKVRTDLACDVGDREADGVERETEILKLVHK